MTIIIWFRQDLRLHDNPALYSAIKRGAIVPIYVYSQDEEGKWPLGAASKWWLHQSLSSLEKSLIDLGGSLCYRIGPHLNSLLEIAELTQAEAVFWNRRYEPEGAVHDRQLQRDLEKAGLTVETFNGNLLVEPWEVSNKQKQPFKVFTPFWKTAEKHSIRDVIPLPSKINFKNDTPSVKLQALQLESKHEWTEGLRDAWQPGEAHALRKIKLFFNKKVEDYQQLRDFPAIDGVSRISPHLHFGEISPVQIWHIRKSHSAHYIRQLYWREFSYYILYHFPFTANKPLRKAFANFPWSNNPSQLKAWQKGQTGYPIIDAGMRQLWKTGWMHNRVRLLVASFLTKDLMIPWQQGAKWFWDTLVDADLANNTMGWQWTAGCGADAAPYFRIFNPTSQSERFDKEGDYIRQWVPELQRLSARWIHNPSHAPAEVLANAGVELGGNYPWPIVDHEYARKNALEAFRAIIKKNTKEG